MRNILYVEDEKNIIDDLQRFYDQFKSKEDWHVNGFLVSSEEANEKKVIKKANECNAEVIVLDMRFHKKDWSGLNLIEPLYQDNPLRPIIVCTVHTNEKPRLRKIFEKGAWDYLFKDTTPNHEFNGVPNFIPELEKKITNASRYRFENSSKDNIFFVSNGVPYFCLLH